LDTLTLYKKIEAIELNERTVSEHDIEDA